VIIVPSSDAAGAYRPQRESRSLFVAVRGLRYHVRCWEAQAGPDEAAPTVFLLHGWMDVSASFQFVVDRLPRHWRVLAPDWRGFGETDRPGADTYWFPDYLGDLDALLQAFSPTQAVDLVGHSMGGNVALLYAGIRPPRVRRVVNLDGLGLPATQPSQAPGRYAKWLDALATGASMRDYPSREAVAERLMRNDPRLRADRAAFLALHWSRETEEGRFALLGDPVHRLPSPILYRVDETLACWREVRADVLLVTAGIVDERSAFAQQPDYEERLLAIRSLRRVRVADAGHMLHHDRPDEIARLIEEFSA
jgi:pimeloyl-ACP methyl ester carboxylesterase